MAAMSKPLVPTETEIGRPATGDVVNNAVSETSGSAKSSGNFFSKMFSRQADSDASDAEMGTKSGTGGELKPIQVNMDSKQRTLDDVSLVSNNTISLSGDSVNPESLLSEDEEAEMAAWVEAFDQVMDRVGSHFSGMESFVDSISIGDDKDLLDKTGNLSLDEEFVEQPPERVKKEDGHEADPIAAEVSSGFCGCFDAVGLFGIYEKSAEESGEKTDAIVKDEAMVASERYSKPTAEMNETESAMSPCDPISAAAVFESEIEKKNIPNWAKADFQKTLIPGTVDIDSPSTMDVHSTENNLNDVDTLSDTPDVVTIPKETDSKPGTEGTPVASMNINTKPDPPAGGDGLQVAREDSLPRLMQKNTEVIGEELSGVIPSDETIAQDDPDLEGMSVEIPESSLPSFHGEVLDLISSKGAAFQPTNVAVQESNPVEEAIPLENANLDSKSRVRRKRPFALPNPFKKWRKHSREHKDASQEELNIVIFPTSSSSEKVTVNMTDQEAKTKKLRGLKMNILRRFNRANDSTKKHEGARPPKVSQGNWSVTVVQEKKGPAQMDILNDLAEMEQEEQRRDPSSSSPAGNPSPESKSEELQTDA